MDREERPGLPFDAAVQQDVLVCAFELPAQGPNRELRPHEVLPALGRDEGLLWLHFRLASPRAQEWLSAAELVPVALLERIREHDGRADFEAIDEGLVVVARDLTFDGEDDLAEASELWAYATAGRLVTGRSHALRSTDALRVQVRGGWKAKSGIALLAAVLEHRSDRLIRVLDQQTALVDDIEDEILRGNITRQRERLGRVRRLCARVRRLFLPERSALRRLLGAPPAWLEFDDAERLRGVNESLSFLIDDANELYERAKLLQEELAARLAETTSDRLYVLSLLSAVLLPMTLVTGIFGMNVAGLPGLQGESSFFWTMLVVLGAGVVTLWLLRRRKLL